ncbi:hypothetical protein SUGI_1074090 [Cryptomeria japonica]|nr:hypothetical protein SUGI_1074090 [Cryptomeria japonica]
MAGSKHSLHDCEFVWIIWRKIGMHDTFFCVFLALSQLCEIPADERRKVKEDPEVQKYKLPWNPCVGAFLKFAEKFRGCRSESPPEH